MTCFVDYNDTSPISKSSNRKPKQGEITITDHPSIEQVDHVADESSIRRVVIARNNEPNPMNRSFMKISDYSQIGKLTLPFMMCLMQETKIMQITNTITHSTTSNCLTPIMRSPPTLITKVPYSSQTTPTTVPKGSIKIPFITIST